MSFVLYQPRDVQSLPDALQKRVGILGRVIKTTEDGKQRLVLMQDGFSLWSSAEDFKNCEIINGTIVPSEVWGNVLVSVSSEVPQEFKEKRHNIATSSMASKLSDHLIIIEDINPIKKGKKSKKK
jgi:hypothetical protein